MISSRPLTLGSFVMAFAAATCAWIALRMDWGNYTSWSPGPNEGQFTVKVHNGVSGSAALEDLSTMLVAAAILGFASIFLRARYRRLTLGLIGLVFLWVAFRSLAPPMLRGSALVGFSPNSTHWVTFAAAILGIASAVLILLADTRKQDLT